MCPSNWGLGRAGALVSGPKVARLQGPTAQEGYDSWDLHLGMYMRARNHELSLARPKEGRSMWI